jgi:hypothetical protein
VFIYFQVIDLKTQLNYFKNVKKVLRQKLGDEETTTMLAKAVYLINIGNNDYFVENSSLYTHEKYVSMVVGNLTDVIKVCKSYLTCVFFMWKFISL